MAEVQQLQVQEAVDTMVKSVEKENIQKMQGLMFQGSANCCEDQAFMQQVHQCMEHCHAPLAQAQALVTNELERFQDRLAQCTMHCNEKAKDSVEGLCSVSTTFYSYQVNSTTPSSNDTDPCNDTFLINPGVL